MGGKGSTLLPAPDKRTEKCIQQLLLKNADLVAAFQLFRTHDIAQRGCVTLSTFYKMLGERKSIFGDSVFELIGIRNFQELTFSEWLHAITTYCLFEEEAILKFCFFILDREKNGYVEKDEIRMLVNMLYHVDPVKGPTGNTKIAFDKLPIQGDGKIEFWEFELFHKAFPSLFFPAFRLQVKMMQAVWGETWWRKRKRLIQSNLEVRRKQEEEDRMADIKRVERMRQRRVRRKMGVLYYYCCPCGRGPYEKMFPKDERKTEDPDDDDKWREQAMEKETLRREMEIRLLNPETQEYKRFKEKVEAKKEKARLMRDKDGQRKTRRPVKREAQGEERRLRLENRRAKNRDPPKKGPGPNS
ncbi:unnamed protein product [Discosporangium mesarthrocarpum]